jgi:excisionase family DNA binding protein
MPTVEDGGKHPLTFALPNEYVEAIAARAAALVLQELQDAHAHAAPSYLTILEVAELLRAKRHRVDDLLSKGVLTRIKDGSRTLIARAELEDYLAGKPTGRRAR